MRCLTAWTVATCPMGTALSGACADRALLLDADVLGWFLRGKESAMSAVAECASVELSAVSYMELVQAARARQASTRSSPATCLTSSGSISTASGRGTLSLGNSGCWPIPTPSLRQDNTRNQSSTFFLYSHKSSITQAPHLGLRAVQT